MKNRKKRIRNSLIMMLSLLLATCTTDPILDPALIGDLEPGQVPIECPDGVISFQYEVLPLLVSNCAFSGCHDAITRAYDIVLDSYEHVMQEVKPGKPNKSELYEAITDGEDDIMPPPPYARLKAEEISLIRQWIEQGAKNTNCTGPCDPDRSSFAAEVYPLMQSYCIGCHNDTQPLGNVNLKDYAAIKPYADNGMLMGSIEHLEGYSPMPPGSNKLTDCQIAQLQKWIDEGAQNN